jgi:septum formation protein
MRLRQHESRDSGVHLCDATEGEHSAILGLPMLALLGFLREREILCY